MFSIIGSSKIKETLLGEQPYKLTRRKTIEKTQKTITLVSSIGADGGQPSKTYTPISAETADRFRSELSLKPCRATMRDGCDDCDGVFGGGNFIVAPSRRKKDGSRSALWNKVKTKAKPVV